MLEALALAAALFAGGSDAPTPYTVTAEGIALPAGVTFPAHGHVNWRTSWAQHGVHFDPNNGHPGAEYIGQSFIPFNLEPGECVTWVQISMYNEHFGEGGQEPICKPTDLPDEVVPVTPPSVPEDPKPPLECEEGYAPGWLDESGNPTGCVSNGIPDPGNEPTPTEDPEWTPTGPPTEEPSTPTELPEPNNAGPTQQPISNKPPKMLTEPPASPSTQPVLRADTPSLAATGPEQTRNLSILAGLFVLVGGTLLVARRVKR